MASDWESIMSALAGISDQDIIEKHERLHPDDKSISRSLNELLKERLTADGWASESPIFQERGYRGKRWRLDFARGDISVEVAFNHGEAIAWNLLKPALASELNYVEKAIQTRVGVVITATKAMKAAGGFDGAVGEYEKMLRYLAPMSSIIPTPLIIVGLEPPETFRIDHERVGNRNCGRIRYLDDRSQTYC